MFTIDHKYFPLQLFNIWMEFLDYKIKLKDNTCFFKLLSGANGTKMLNTTVFRKIASQFGLLFKKKN